MDEIYDGSIIEEIRRMPKLEFHGHLNGLIPVDLLNKYIFNDDLTLNQYDFSYNNFFNVLKLCSKKMREYPQLKLEALDLIVEDYIQQNCVYLELRDTPKESQKQTFGEYIIELITKVDSIQKKYKDKILIKFFLNLHKMESLKENNFKVLEEFKKLPDLIKDYIIGIDIGGPDFNFNYFEANKYIYSYFKELNYKVNFHLYEKEEENLFKEIIDFKPDRISQCIYLNNKEELDYLITSKIPLEICPSFCLASTGRKQLIEQENYKYLMENNHPILIGTDNSYLLRTNLTEEYIKFYEFKKELAIQNSHPVLDINDPNFVFNNRCINDNDSRILFQIENILKFNNSI